MYALPKRLRAMPWLAPAPVLFAYVAVAWSSAGGCDSGACAQGALLGTVVVMPLAYFYFVVLCARLASHLETRGRLAFGRFCSIGVAVSAIPFLMMLAFSIWYRFEILAALALLAVAAISAAAVISLWWLLKFGFHSHPASEPT
jgi:hypothetical protein